MTQVNWSRNLILAVVLVGLGYAAYWAEYKHKPQKEEAESFDKKVVSLKDTQVQSILLSDGTRTFEFLCSDFDQNLCKPGDNSKWQVVAPKKLKADDANVNSLISAANNIEATETISLAEETPEKKAQLLKDYGLDPASRETGKRILFRTPKDEKSKEKSLHLGGTHPIGQAIFAYSSADENRVYLLPNYFRANLEHDLTYWRDKKLLTLAAHDISGFKINSAKGSIAGEKKDGQWMLKSGGEEFPGDIENVDSLLSGATYLTARDFVEDGKAVLSGAKSLSALKLAKAVGDKREEITLTIFQKGADKPSPKFYATVSNLDPVFELDAGVKDRFVKGVKDLRLAKILTSMERFAATRLEFSRPGLDPALVLTQKDGKWMIEAANQEAANSKVQALLDRISGNRIQEFISGARIPPGQDKGTIVTLGDEKESSKRKLVFWKSENQLYARDLLSKRQEAFQVDLAIESALPTSRDFFNMQQAPVPSPTPSGGER